MSNKTSVAERAYLLWAVKPIFTWKFVSFQSSAGDLVTLKPWERKKSVVTRNCLDKVQRQSRNKTSLHPSLFWSPRSYAGGLHNLYSKAKENRLLSMSCERWFQNMFTHFCCRELNRRKYFYIPGLDLESLAAQPFPMGTCPHCSVLLK